MPPKRVLRKQKPSSAPKPRAASAPERSFFRSLLRLLRNVILTLAVISGLAYIPPPWLQSAHPDLQEAVRLCGEIRALTVRVAKNMSVWSLDQLGDAGQLADATLRSLLPDSADWLPWTPSQTVASNPQETAVPTGKLPRTASSFTLAKKALYEHVYYDYRQTFYCGCRYSEDRQVNLSSCGMQSLGRIQRALRVEAEHVFPASQFGNFRRCWREPEKVCQPGKRGRQCCEASDPVFRAAHNDLHNLYPAVGEINGKRSNYNWAMIPREVRRFGDCDFEVQGAKAEPTESVRGDIARTLFYMSETYGFRLSKQDTQLYRAWNNLDPPSAWERERNARIKAIQGMGNGFIERYEKME